MGVAGPALMIGQLALGAVSAFAQISQTNAAARASNAAAERNAILMNRELTRQQQEVQKATDEKKSDRVRQADREAATLMNLLGELGASASSATSLITELGFVEGRDISRIHRNSQSQIATIQSRKETGNQDIRDEAARVRRSAVASNLDAGLGFLGSGLQIGAGEVERRDERERRRNRT